MAQTSSTAGNRNAAVPPYDTLSARLERPLVTPEDPEYDEARAVYNAMIDRRPGRPGDLPEFERRGGLRSLRCRARGRAGHPWRRPQRWRTRCVGRRPRGGSVRDASGDGRPHDPHRAGGRRLHVERRRSCDLGARHGHTERLSLINRSGWPHARRRDRLPHASLRSHRRQPSLGRGRTRRRSACDRERRLPPGPVLGAPRRWRETSASSHPSRSTATPSAKRAP